MTIAFHNLVARLIFRRQTIQKSIWRATMSSSVFWVPSEASGDWRSVQLPHPRSGATVSYFLSSDGRRVLEPHQTDGSRSSWFVGEAVQQDGGVVSLVPVHAFFLVLPYLFPDPAETSAARRRMQSVFCTLENVLEEHDAGELGSLAQLGQLGKICDVRSVEDIGDHYRINTDKLMDWLKGTELWFGRTPPKRRPNA